MILYVLLTIKSLKLTKDEEVSLIRSYVESLNEREIGLDSMALIVLSNVIEEIK